MTCTFPHRFTMRGRFDMGDRFRASAGAEDHVRVHTTHTEGAGA